MLRGRWRSAIWRAGDSAPSEPGDGWDGVRVGSEGCARLVPGPSRLEGIRDSADAGRLSLITPALTPSEFPRLLAAARSALEAGWDEVVVNDWGLLDALSLPGRGRLTAGRLLMRARRGPGEGDPWPGLDPSSREYLAWGPLRDRPFLDFLRSKGVARLELDPPRHPHPLRVPGGFHLSLHADHRLVTLAGNCPFLFDAGEGRWAREGCALACLDRPLRLSAPAPARPLVQWGRAVMEDARGELSEGELPPQVDRLVFFPDLFP